MPLVTVKLIENVLTPAQKQEMVRRVTDAIVAVEGEALRPVTWVILEDVKTGDWGMGGKTITTCDVKAMIAGHKQL